VTASGGSNADGIASRELFWKSRTRVLFSVKVMLLQIVGGTEPFMRFPWTDKN